MKTLTHFNQTQGIKTKEEKFQYIKNHARYYTMNSWNRTQSIAHNVKIYNLPLTKEENDKLDIIMNNEGLCNDFYGILKLTIEEIEECIPFKLGFNGRSGGYLVAYNLNNCHTVLNTEDYYYYSTYQEAKKDGSDIFYYLDEDFKTVVMFDNACDVILDSFKNTLTDVTIETVTYTVEKKRLALAV